MCQPPLSLALVHHPPSNCGLRFLINRQTQELQWVPSTFPSASGTPRVARHI